MEIWSHRGRASPNELGNSLKSFITAYGLDVTGIEADICFTTDNRIIVYHPESTNPDLAKMSWNDIDKSIFNVLELYEFLDLIKSFNGTKCCLDIKQNSKRLALEAAEMIIRKGLQNLVYLVAFQRRIPALKIETDGQLLIDIKEIYPEIKTNIMATFPFNLEATVEKYGADMISFGWVEDSLTTKAFFKFIVKPFAGLKEQIAQVRQRGVKVLGGVANNPDKILYLKNLGVDGIVTDNPKLVFELTKTK